jgi:hypothetical protein
MYNQERKRKNNRQFVAQKRQASVDALARYDILVYPMYLHDAGSLWIKAVGVIGSIFARRQTGLPAFAQQPNSAESAWRTL